MSLVAAFQTQDGAWAWPERLNMAAQVCDDWAARDPDRLAIIDLTGPRREDVSYGALRALSGRVAAALTARGVAAGDRVGVLLSQSPLCAAAHIAAWRIGAITVPLFKLFGPEALASRLDDSGAKLVVTDADGRDMLAPFDVVPVTGADLPEAGLEAKPRPLAPKTRRS